MSFLNGQGFDFDGLRIDETPKSFSGNVSEIIFQERKKFDIPLLLMCSGKRYGKGQNKAGKKETAIVVPYTLLISLDIALGNAVCCDRVSAEKVRWLISAFTVSRLS